jgi:hypothetical protein
MQSTAHVLNYSETTLAKLIGPVNRGVCFGTFENNGRGKFANGKMKLNIK